MDKTIEKDRNIKPTEPVTLNPNINSNINPNINLNVNINSNINSNQPKTQLEKEVSAEKEYKKLLNELHESSSAGQMTSQAQIKRLLGTNYINPYDVLMLTGVATEEEVRKQYKLISVLLHPDKCSDPRASDAFHIIESAYKTLQDPDKRKIYQRIIREAKERVDFEREKENKKRIKKGLVPLPEDNLEFEIQAMVKLIMEELEEKKSFMEKQEMSQQKREREEHEFKRMQEEYEKQYNKEWESSRDKRVKNWTKFKDKITCGKKKAKNEIRPPQLKAEERPENIQKPTYDLSKGGYEDYRKNWR